MGYYEIIYYFQHMGVTATEIGEGSLQLIYYSLGFFSYSRRIGRQLLSFNNIMGYYEIIYYFQHMGVTATEIGEGSSVWW